MADWTSNSDDSDKFDWDSDGEAEPSLAPAMRNFDAPGPSTLSSNGWINGEAPPTSLIEGYVAMGFPKEMVVRSIKEIGHSDADALLELLLTYKALGDDDDAVGNHSTSGCNPTIVEDDDDLDFEKWDGDDDTGGRESSSDDSGYEEFLREMSDKDEKINSLRDMGFSEDEANMAITICGVDADLSVLVDSISASQVTEVCHSRNLSDHQVTARCFDSFGGRKRARLIEESKKKRKRYGGGAQGKRPSSDGSDEESMPLPNPMVGFNLPAARKRGYIHNLPTENRSPLLPLPPKTIFEAFPHYKKWWPSWDQRTHFNCLQTCTASAPVTERIQQKLSSSGNPPPQSVQKYVRHQCSKWNLVWVGKDKAAPLEPHEMEYLLGFPKDHTRGFGKTQRYKSLGNSFQVDTVAYHLSVLRDMFPNGITVLSLFTGIGGGEVALHKLGIHRAVVSVEICKANRKILRSWWDQTQTGTLIEIADVKSLKDDEIASYVSRFGGFDLVIGGSPCCCLDHMDNMHSHDAVIRFPSIDDFKLFKECAAYKDLMQMWASKVWPRRDAWSHYSAGNLRSHKAVEDTVHATSADGFKLFKGSTAYKDGNLDFHQGQDNNKRKNWDILVTLTYSIGNTLKLGMHNDDD
ncbi:DNA (cytosine-5)-methyltransferase DRM2 [Triticum urartu]|uniref:DNA (Cytosine-5)-methyltransferase DRM2 n=1 Tax=Triticum urartu TaxID=4572 RepID=M7ZZV0_TRIUA|nr:DNA (cytosine-5)-methyltransferase DRM2 [Triticum urartu]